MLTVRTSATSGMLRSSAIWQSGSTLITPPDKASRKLFETSSSRKSGTRLIASIKESRLPAPRRRDHLRQLDRQSKRQPKLPSNPMGGPLVEYHQPVISAGLSRIAGPPAAAVHPCPMINACGSYYSRKN